MRRGTASQWQSVNPVLGAGEMGFESDTRKFKFGNGTTNWNAMPYASAGGVEAGGFFVADTAPVGANVGDIWYCSSDTGTEAGRSFIYYDGYWVELNPGVLGPKGDQGDQGIQGVAGAPYGNIDGGKADSAYGGTTTLIQGGSAGTF